MSSVHEYLELAYRAVVSEAWRIFCRPGTRFVEHYECRGTKLSKQLLTIQVYRADCGLWRGQGIKAVGIYQGAGANAKNVTSLFTLLSVLCVGLFRLPTSISYYYKDLIVSGAKSSNALSSPDFNLPESLSKNEIAVVYDTCVLLSIG